MPAAGAHAATGLDALVHAAEAFTNKGVTPVVEAMALQAIRQVAENLGRAVAAPDDVEARGKMALASALAGSAIDGCGTALAHGFGHALATMAPVHHGRAVALALRVILPWASGIRPDRYAPIAVALGARPSANDDDASTAKLAAPLFEALIRSVGLPVSLEDVGLGEADTERLVEITLAPENKPMVDSNTVEPSVDDLRMMARQILTAR